MFGIFVLAISLFFAYMLIPIQKATFQKIMFTQAETISKSIVQTNSDAIINKDFSFIVEHINAVIKNDNIIYIIVSPKNDAKILIGHEHWSLIDKVDDPILESQNITFGIINTNDNINVYHFVCPIQLSGFDWGWLHIGFSTDQYDKHIHSMYEYFSYIICVTLAVILLVGYLFARWIARPITLISQLATQVASGNLDAKSTIKRRDEIGILSDSFNKMIDSLLLAKMRLENYNQELEQQVVIRVKELDELNKYLDEKIKNEIAKNQKQEALMIQQSRLAAMGEMIGAIAHQWRQPLNALGLVHQNLYIMYKSGRLDDALMARSMEKSERLIQKMSSTIDDFRKFFKPNKHIENFNIKSTIHATVDLVDAQLRDNNIDIQIICSDDLTVKSLKGEFSQVMLNLISNAKDILIERKSSQPKITIEASLNANQKDIIIVVKDNDGGIPEAILDKIYDPYFTTKEEGKGTGIGLYMSKIIIENNMGGRLHAINDSEGANFIIEIST